MRSIYNFVSKPSDIEDTDTSCDKVVPNCSLSVKQIIERFRRTGIPGDLANPNFYDSDDNDIDSPVIEVSDLTDLSDISHNYNTVLEKVKSESSKVKDNT